MCGRDMTQLAKLSMDYSIDRINADALIVIAEQVESSIELSRLGCSRSRSCFGGGVTKISGGVAWLMALLQAFSVSFQIVSTLVTTKITRKSCYPQ